MCDTPRKGIVNLFCVAHTTTTAKPQNCWDFPIGCIALMIFVIVFVIVSGGQKWQPLLMLSFKVGSKVAVTLQTVKKRIGNIRACGSGIFIRNLVVLNRHGRRNKLNI